MNDSNGAAEPTDDAKPEEQPAQAVLPSPEDELPRPLDLSDLTAMAQLVALKYLPEGVGAIVISFDFATGQWSMNAGQMNGANVIQLLFRAATKVAGNLDK